MALGLPEDFRFNIFARDRSGPAWRGVRQSAAGASRAVMGFMRSFGPLLGVSGVAGLGAITAQALDTAEALESASDRVGLTVEQLQELRYAGVQNRVAFEQTDMAMQRFSRRLAEAAQGGGELRAALADNNIAMRNADGSMRDSYDILLDYADAIAGAESEQEQLRLAFKAFDSEGAALVNIFREGRDGLREYGAEAREAGIIMEEGLVRQGAEAARVMREMRQTVSAQATQAVLENAEGIERLAEALGQVAEWAVGAAAGMARFLSSLRDVGDEREQALSLQELANDLDPLTGGEMANVPGVQTRLTAALGGQEGGRIWSMIEGFDRHSGFRANQFTEESRIRIADLLRDMAAARVHMANLADEQAEQESREEDNGGGGGTGGAYAARLAAARERLELENALELARANGDKAAEASAEQELALMQRIAALRSAGYAAAEAEAEARRIQDALDAAQDLSSLAEKEIERRQLSERLAVRELQHQRDIAALRGDDATVRRLERELALRQQIAELMELGIDGDDARIMVERELDASELARRQGEYRGVFRDAFRDGFLAMLDGNGDALSEWWREYTTRGLERALDAVADQVFNLFSNALSGSSNASGSGSGGLLGSFLGSVLGGLTGGGGGGVMSGFSSASAASIFNGSAFGGFSPIPSAGAASALGSATGSAMAPAAAQIRQIWSIAVDARGATDPADVEARVNSAIAAVRPQILAESEARLPAVIQQLSRDRKI
jgi:hypothetical protein